jgi:hypothetical protein
MRRALELLFLIFLVSCDQVKQPAEVKAPDTVASIAKKAVEATPALPTEPIALIRHQVENINTIKLEKKHFEFMCDEKMMLDYFYADGEIVKISVDFATIGDVYAREDYYYDSGKLIFNYEFVEGGPACEGCIKTDEYRSYIVDNKVVKYLKNKTDTTCRTCAFSSASRQYKLLLATTAEEMKEVLCR